MLELYHWEPNTFHLKPLIALKEKQLDFTGHYYDPTRFEQFSPGFPCSTETRHNRDYEGPVLINGATIMCGSFFLLEFIAESVPGPELYSVNPYERYQMQEWGQVTGTALAVGISVLGCMKYLTPVLETLDQEQLSSTIEKIEPVERRLRWLELTDGSLDEERMALIRSRLSKAVRQVEERLVGSSWLVGGHFSIADIDIFSMIWTLPGLAPELVNKKDTPYILDYINRIKQRPAVRSAFAMSHSGRPHECFVPGIEASRWLGL